MAHQLKLPNGRVVAKGMLAHTDAYRARLSNQKPIFKNSHKLRALPPPPPNIVNSVGVVLDAYGNAPSSPQDPSYTGSPVGDCTCATIATILVLLSQCTLSQARRAVKQAVEGHAKGEYPWNLQNPMSETRATQLVFLAKTVVAWYFVQTGGVDSGCNILDVLNAVENTPMLDVTGTPWTFGPSGAVDYTSQAEVQQAIYLFKALDLGVDASPLESAVGSSDGWVVSGLKRQITNYDHSVPVFDFGEAGALFDAWKIPLPTNSISATDLGVGGSTWGFKGFWELQSFIYATGEAHAILTSPARCDSETWDAIASADYVDVTSSPVPTPLPPPAPGPAPGPTPTPTHRGSKVQVRLAALHEKGGDHAKQVEHRIKIEEEWLDHYEKLHGILIEPDYWK
jgi:hypothetical protein